MSHFSLERFPFEGNDNKTATVATINGRLLNPSSTLMITNGNTTNPKLRTFLEMDGTFKIVQFQLRGYIIYRLHRIPVILHQLHQSM